MRLLLESEVDRDPLKQFDRWYREAAATGAPLWDAMALSTSSKEGQPSSRMVLLKGYDDGGFVFYTNYDSRKSTDLKRNPFGALLFWWPSLDRQIRIEGVTAPVSERESDDYFASRPRGSQLGAWASEQSQILPDRETLEKRLEDIEKRYAGKPVPRPPYWGGFRLRPQSYEFWQNQPNRLHDRLRYRRDEERWILERLAP